MYVIIGVYKIKGQLSLLELVSSKATTTPSIKPPVELKPEIPQEVIKKLEEGNIASVYSGRIVNLTENSIVVNSAWYNPFTNSLEYTPLNIQINAQDEIVYYQGKKLIPLKLSDLKINDYVLVSTKENKKRIVLLTPRKL